MESLTNHTHDAALQTETNAARPPGPGPARPAPGSEGAITVSVRFAGGRVAAVRVRGRDLMAVLGALRGQQIGSAPALARALFPICGIAHETACRRAIEASLDTPWLPRVETKREVLLLFERGVSAVWRAAIDWPALLGRTPQIAAVKTARSALSSAERILDADVLTAISPPLRDLAAEIAHSVETVLPDTCSLVQLTAQLDPTPARRVLAHFCRLIADSRRTAARLRTLALRAPPRTACRSTPFVHHGMGLAATVRGALAYTVHARDGIIEHVTIAAPTDRIATSDGELAGCLMGLSGASPATVERKARIVVAAFDPCAPIEIEFARDVDA